MSTLLVTGGAGYIGAHTIVELLAAGHEVVCLDNYSNSSPAALARVQRIAGRGMTALEGDVRDAALLARVFATHPIDGVIHFAALKAVGESVAQPLAYYENNVAGTLTLAAAMQKAGVTRFVFSSSATVYGAPDVLPVTEDAPIRTANPYGATKAMVEQILRDAAAAYGWSVVSLRYFNPIGAHASGLIGEDPHDVPNNLFPFVCQVAAGKRPHLNVFGDDWPTVDGTGVRDYLHVMDLAAGHVRAYEYAQRQRGFVALNLGTGRGTSVLELVRAFEAATGQRVPYRIAPRRPGDIAACWADPSRAQQLLGWRATRSIAEACADGWRWQRLNPDGYRGQAGKAT
ncbi:MAG: UDP-glucose 4-epimerase GalE [Burkholderiaceae bacterium]|nr:UDP-glucose 4-epimerase GalE [Burkholderiaceae bacterium]